MTIPTAEFALWLQSPALFAVDKDAAIESAWGDDAATSEAISAIALASEASTEAKAQLTFLGQAFAIEVHELKGRLAPYIGKVTTITVNQLGYDAGLDVLVLGALDDLGTGMSKATVLRRLT